MLGCQDFCGYYDWTFAHVREELGQDAVRQLWAEAIGGESQRAYAEAAKRDGLRGLLSVWTQTGQDEGCDWTFTLDEAAGVLRWDMRKCPSKGFLIDNDLNADEDYCDHCMGWIAPLLAGANVEVSRHEHNHRGQCWAEMRVAGTDYVPLTISADIRRHEDWNKGYVDTFVDGNRASDDPVDRLVERIGSANVIGDEQWLAATDSSQARAIVLGEDLLILKQVTERWLAMNSDERPLLLHAYFPHGRSIDFVGLGFGRPLPILPALIRAGVYRHVPGAEPPSTQEQARLVGLAIERLTKR